ncbi:hypothetical protein M758_9G064300 [Ceratodon purpureus]|nr:hypothetical protein M758_9G064300 [Ceratodon purpureus]
MSIVGGFSSSCLQFATIKRWGKGIKCKVPRGSNSLIDNLGIVSQGNR